MIRIVTENFGLKILSLGVAVLLWFATVGEPEMTASVAVPVQYRNTPGNMEISSDLIDSAFVEMRGASGRLTGSSLANAVVVIDLLGERRPGERTFSILSENVKLPPGVTFVRAVPSQIRMHLETRVTRDVPIVVRYAAPPPEGYRISVQEVNPSLARIIGPESRVNAIDRLQTDPVELTTDQEQTFRLHAYAGDPQVRLERSDLKITVIVGLEKSR